MRLVVLALLLLAGCRYRERELCPSTGCAENLPPVVVITDVESLALTIGANGNVTLDARESYDPEGDTPLTFAWSTDCTGTASADAGLYTISGATGVCPATVVVTDPSGASAEAVTVTITVSATDSYVSGDRALKCAETFDLASGGGTRDNPFCSLGIALQAAAVVRFDAIKLDASVHFTPSLTITRTTAIRGGYTRRDDAEWLQEGTSEIAFNDPAATSGFLVPTGAALTLEDVGVFFSAPCEVDCSVLASSGGSVIAEDVTIGLSVLPGRPRTPASAPGQVYASVSMIALTDTSAELELTRVTTYGASDAKRSVGVFVSGPVDVTLNDTRIYDRSSTQALGLYTRGAKNVAVNDGSIELTMTGGDALAFGDGDQNGVFGGSNVVETCSAAGPCRGSQSVTLTDVSIDITGARNALGVAGLSTRALTTRGGSYSLSGQRVIGILTLSAGDVLIASPVSALVTVSGGAAVVYSDGYVTESPLRDVAPTSRVTLDGAVLGAANDASGATILIGARFSGTQVVRLSSPSIAVGTGVQAVGLLVGISTRSLRDVIATGVNLRAQGTIGLAAYGWIDGDINPSGAPVTAERSENLEIVPGETEVTTIGTRSTVVGGFGFAASKNVYVHDGGPMTIRAFGSNLVSGLTSLGGEALRYEGLSVSATRTPVGGGETGDRVAVGVYDGHPTLETLASSGLVVARCALAASATNALAGGVFIQGRGANQAVIANNYIVTDLLGASIGVGLQYAGAAIAFNTMRLGGLLTRPVTGVYVAYNEAIPVTLTGNVLAATPADRPDDFASFLVEYHPSSDDPFYVSASDWNFYSCDSVNAGDCVQDGPVPYLRKGSGSLAQFPDPSSFPVGTVVGGTNRAQQVVFCSDDGPHITSTSAARGYVATSVGTHGNDIDNQPRTLPFDAGADTFSGECPP